MQRTGADICMQANKKSERIDDARLSAVIYYTAESGPQAVWCPSTLIALHLPMQNATNTTRASLPAKMSANYPLFTHTNGAVSLSTQQLLKFKHF